MVASHPASRILRVASLGIVALACSIPVSVALDNVLLFLLLVLVLLGGGREVLRVATGNPVARASVLLFVALCLGTLYGMATWTEAVDTLGKYADLGFVPLLMVAAREERTRRTAMLLFLAVMSVTAALSWLVGVGVLPVAEWMRAGCTIDNPAIFRSSITQSILMAYATHVFMLCARITAVRRNRWLYLALALLAASSILFMVQGKTGYLVLIALLIYFAWGMWSRHLGLRGLAMGWRQGIALGLMALFLSFSVYQAVPRLHERVDQALREFKGWQPEINSHSSTGLRLEFYYNSLQLIEQHPLLGVGTGGYQAAYIQQVQSLDGEQVTPNPHNEYLLITSQLGLGGLLLLLYLFVTQWRCAAKLPSAFEQDAARGLVLAIAITALFNSPLLDHTEGIFFALTSALLFANLNSPKRGG